MKKIVSLILVAIMIVACVPFSILTASAAGISEWPGAPMRLYDSANNIYGLELPSRYNCFIFTDGNYYNGSNNGVAWQTDDIIYIGSNKLYIPNLNDTSYVNGATRCSVSSSDYSYELARSDRMIYFKAPSNWEIPSCYCWASDDYIDPDTGFPANAYNFGGSYYKVYSNVCGTWTDAKAYCESLGGHLAVISSKEENDALYSYVTSCGYQNAYFGLSDREKEGQWEWVTGEPVSYTNWNQNEPNSESSSEDYAMFYFKYTSGKWNDGNFGNGTVSDSQVFICEWESFEIRKDSTPFDLKTDGYSFPNARVAFGYFNETDKIPEQIYADVYGKKAKQLRDSDSTWGGNCFGMAVTASLFNEGTLNAKNYTNSSKSVNSSAFTTTMQYTDDKTCFNNINESHEVRKLIERYQIWQDSVDCHNWKSNNLWVAGNVSGTTPYVSSVLRNYDNYYVSIGWLEDGKEVGHAVVIDSSRPPVRLNDDGWYRVYIYDPNNPYYKSFGWFSKAASCYSSATNRYFDVNVKTDQWRIDVGINSADGPTRVGYTDNNTYIDGSTIIIRRPTSTLPTSFNGTATWYYAKDKANTANLCSENAVVYDADGNVLFEVANNKTVYVDDSVVVEPRTYALDEDVTASYTIELPVHEFTIEFGSEGTAQVFNEDYCYGLVSDAAGSATVTTSDGITINGDADSTVDVVVERLEDDDTFTSVNVVVENDGENSTYISLDESKELTVNNAENSFDALVYSDVQENEYLISNVNTEEVAGENIVDYALNTGELVPNEISGADFTYRNQFAYDGTEKTFAPVLKYMGKELAEGVDYTIEGDVSQTEIGNYSVTITGQGNYSGTVTLEYQIVPKFEFEGASLSLGGNVGVNFYLGLADEVFMDDNAKVLFVLPNGNTKSVPLSEAVTSGDGNYVFTCEVAAKEMASTVTAQVVTSDDKSEVFEYSVQEYADYVITEAEAGNETYTAAAPLVKAMLNYGAYAQEYFGYNTENLANDILPEEDKQLPEAIDLSAHKYIIEGSEAGVTHYGSKLTLDSDTALKHYFIIEDEENIPLITVNGEEVTATKKGEYYEVKITDILAQNLDEKIVVKVGGLTIDYNALSYARLAMNTGDEKLKDVMKALYAYNVAADAYLLQQ